MNGELQMVRNLERATLASRPTFEHPSILPLRLESVSYEAGGKRLVDCVTATLERGPRTVILGANGAGKSLLLRLAHGLIAPSAGSVTWLGRSVPGGYGAADGKAVIQRQAMVFQRPVMLRRSVIANVAYALKQRGVPRAGRSSRAIEALSRTGLAGHARQPARSLSGGEQQRLALARAWASEPDVLFLDEPTASLDPAATRAIEDIIEQMHDGGTKIVMTTHDLGQARRLADEVLFLHRGRLVERQPADAFFTCPATAEATAFIEGRLHW